MLSRFIKTRPIRKPAATPQSGEFVVRDSRTHLIIARGDEAACRAYANGFGLCYVQAANTGVS